MPRAETLAARAMCATGHRGVVVLADDRTVHRLNARDRARNKPTNVLTYEPSGPGLPGQIILAAGVVRREAIAASRRPAYHMAHLVVHGALHLAGHDHLTRWRGAPDGNGRGSHSAADRRSQPLAARMSGALSRLGLLGRVRALLQRRGAEHSVRELIAELVEEAAAAPQTPGVVPELDRHERALIANVLRLRGTTAGDVMVPRADIVAMRADLTFQQAVERIATMAIPACRSIASSSITSSAWSTSRMSTPMWADRRNFRWKRSCAGR